MIKREKQGAKACATQAMGLSWGVRALMVAGVVGSVCLAWPSFANAQVSTLSPPRADLSGRLTPAQIAAGGIGNAQPQASTASAAPAQTPPQMNSGALSSQGDPGGAMANDNSIPASQIPLGAGGGNNGQQQPPMTLPPLPAAATKVDPARVMDDVFGLTPSEIRELHRQSDLRTRAASEYPSGKPPQPVTTSVVASLSPGATPPVVRVAVGFASAIVVTDSTGAAWPIENFVVGNKDAIDVERPVARDENGSSLSVVPKGYYGQTNLMLYLSGSPTPVLVTLVAGQNKVDYRADLRVLGQGPNARAPMVAGLPQAGNTQLLSLLEGVAPDGAKPLQVTDPAVQAWMERSGRIMVRTSLQIISPAWISSVRSADGTSAYEMAQTSSLLVMREGRITTVSLQGW